MLVNFKVKYLSIKIPLRELPRIAPNPLVIIINNPCALALFSFGTFEFTNKEPEILKKSKAIPYTIQETIIIQSPSVGFPKDSNPKRKTHAIILINITFLIPNLDKKNGIARMNKVSETCEIDMIMVEYFTENESAYFGKYLKKSK